MSGARLGAVVGSVGGLIFILVNAGGLPDPAAWVVRVAGIAAFLASLWLQRTRSGGADDGTRPDRRAMRVYSSVHTSCTSPRCSGRRSSRRWAGS